MKTRKTGRPKEFFWAVREWNRDLFDVSPYLSSGQSRDRTGDLRIFSPSLYQLSYLSFVILYQQLTVRSVFYMTGNGRQAYPR